MKSGIEWVPREDVETPKDRHQVLVDYWWPVNAQGEVALHIRRTALHQHVSPMANPQKVVCEKVGKVYLPEMVDIVQIPLAYIPQSSED